MRSLRVRKAADPPPNTTLAGHFSCYCFPRPIDQSGRVRVHAASPNDCRGFPGGFSPKPSAAGRPASAGNPNKRAAGPLSTTQSPQNFETGGLRQPQHGQGEDSGAPHSVQNRLSSGTSARQLGHSMPHHAPWEMMSVPRERCDSSRSVRDREIQSGSRTVNVDTYQALTGLHPGAGRLQEPFQIMGRQNQTPETVPRPNAVVLLLWISSSGSRTPALSSPSASGSRVSRF